MKIRTCFVSNSSSSSFICDVCGRNESGYDISIEDAGMYECEQMHIFCEDEALNKDALEEIDDRYNVDEKFCPICQLSSIREKDLLKYFLMEHSTTEEKMAQKIKKRFGTYAKFYDYLWG